MRTLLLTLYIVSSLFAPAQANEEPGISEEKKHTCYLCSVLDRPQLYLSDKFLKFSDRIDIFFSKSRSYDRLNKSFASLHYYIVTSPSARPEHYLDTRVYLTLPRTQERLALMLQTETDSELDIDNPDIAPGTPDKNTDAIALRSDMFSGKQWRIFMDIGAEYQNGLEPFIRATYINNYTLGKWSIHWREAIFRFANTGNGISSSLSTERTINDKYLLRISNKLINYIDQEYSEPIHSISLAEKINNYSALVYTIGTFGSYEPTDKTDYFQLRYKRLIHKTWLYYELIPEVLISNSNSRQASGRFTFKLEYLIGNY